MSKIIVRGNGNLVREDWTDAIKELIKEEEKHPIKIKENE